MMLSCFRPVIGTVAQEDSNDNARMATDTVKTNRLRFSGKILSDKRGVTIVRH